MKSENEIVELIQKYKKFLAKGEANLADLSNQQLEVQRILNWVWGYVLQDLHDLADTIRNDSKTP